ncbi:MAG: ABC transporter permease [Halobacteria archaeon]
MWAIAKRELRAMASERSFLLGTGLQLFVALFSSLLAVGLLSLYSPAGLEAAALQPRLALVTDDPGLSDLVRSEVRRVVPYPSEEAAREAFAARRVDGLLVAPSGPPPIELRLVLARNEVTGPLLLTRLKPALERFEDSVRRASAPDLPDPAVPATRATGAAATFELAYGLLVPLLMFLPGILAGALLVDLLAREWEEKTLDVLRAAPVGPATIVAGKLLAAILLVVPQAAAWLGLLALNDVPVAAPERLLLLATAVGAAMGGVGAALALLFRDRALVQVLYSLALMSLFLALFSIPGGPVNSAARVAVGMPAPDLLLAGMCGLGVVAMLGALKAAERRLWG